jgi:hypothetical protein
LDTSRRVRSSASHAWAVGLAALLGAGYAARADAPAAPNAAASASSDEPQSLPQDGLFSSIKQSLRESDQEIIRGHFDLGVAPNVHRYYCLMDAKSHRREPNGVLGDPLPRPDGMTGIKSSAVSLYRCDKAEEKGLLVTAGYVVPVRPAAAAAAPSTPPPASPATAAAAPSLPPPAAPVPVSPSAPAAPPPAAPAAAAVSPFSSSMPDVSGVRLGMSLEEVRSVLKAKNLPDRNEWSETLSYRSAGSGTLQPVPNGRFVNVLAASSRGASAAEGNYDAAGESFEVMFTPVPGHEQAMAIVHTVGYAPANAIHETALESGLIEKYGGAGAGAGLPHAASWEYGSTGAVSMGDGCGRRGVLGGLGALHVSSARENIALEKSASELEFEVQHCGMAIVTEDHHLADGGALREDRMVTRYTVTAYSPTLAAQGAARAQEILRAADPSHGKAIGVRPRDSHAPDL